MAEDPRIKAGAIVLAGGSSRRMEGVVEDKILWPLQGRAVIIHSIEAFIKSGVISQIILVCKDDAQMTLIANEIQRCSLDDFDITYCMGGKERQNSVFNGLQQLDEQFDHVFIHDAARPNINSTIIAKMNEILVNENAVSLAHRVTDTVKKCSEEKDPTQEPVQLIDLDRKTLWAMETPQAFRRKDIFEAYTRVFENNIFITDDNAAFEYNGGKILILENPDPNPKLTTPDDLNYLNYIFSKEKL